MYNSLNAPQQNLIVRTKLNKLQPGDSVLFKKANGGINILAKVQDIQTNKEGNRRFHCLHLGREVFVLESLVIDVIPQSKDTYDDLGEVRHPQLKCA